MKHIMYKHSVFSVLNGFQKWVVFYKYFSIFHATWSLKSLVRVFLATERLKTVSVIERLLYNNINTMNKNKSQAADLHSRYLF